MAPKLITPRQVAEMFNVNPKTVGRWARDGKLREYRTPGGHRRFDEQECETLLEESSNVSNM